MSAGREKPNNDGQEGKNFPEQLYSGYVELFSILCMYTDGAWRGWEEVWNIYNDIIATRDAHTHWCRKFFAQPKLAIVLTYKFAGVVCLE